MIYSRRLLLVSTFLLFGLITSCAPASSNSITSPDGSLVLITAINHDRTNPTTYLCVKFQIADNQGNIRYEEQTYASDKMKWTMKWDGNKRVILESADIGTSAWEQGMDGVWQKIR